jgi:hypothetical protein
VSFYNPITRKVVGERNSDTWLIPLIEHKPLVENTSFVPRTQFQFVWDSVSLAALKTCPRFYYYSIILGYEQHPTPSPISFGIFFHKCMEVWHKLITLEVEKEYALKSVVKLAGLLGEKILPGRTERTKETLVRAVTWYIDQFYNDAARTALHEDGTPAVEMHFQLPIIEDMRVTSISGPKETEYGTFEDRYQTIYLAGHLDRVCHLGGQVYLSDYKTTKGQLDEKFLAQFKPNTQMSGYLVAGHILASKPTSVFPTPPDGIIVDGIQLQVNANRFQRFRLPYTEAEANAWLEDFEATIRVKAYGYAECKHWPMEETSCERYGGCQFRKVCSATPSDRQRILDGHFRRATWDPQKPREF